MGICARRSRAVQAKAICGRVHGPCRDAVVNRRTAECPPESGWWALTAWGQNRAVAFLFIRRRGRDSNSRTGCSVAGVPPLCTRTISANASGAVATLGSAGTGPRLRRVGVGLPGAVSPSRAKRPDAYSRPASSASRCSDRGIVQAHDVVSRSPVSVRRACARICSKRK